MRLDCFLWFARLSATRGLAQRLATGGHLRIDGRPVAKPATTVRVGNVLTYATHRGAIRVLRIERLLQRRGVAAEARTCYTDLAPVDASRVQIYGTDPVEHSTQ